MTGYHINVFFSDEDGGYIADLLDLEASRQGGRQVPAPRYLPAASDS